MKIFFKFLWMGISTGLLNILYFIFLILPIVIGVIMGWALSRFISILLSILCGIVIMGLGYWIIFSISHAAAATKYCKEHNTDSLKEAWSNTSW